MIELVGGLHSYATRIVYHYSLIPLRTEKSAIRYCMTVTGTRIPRLGPLNAMTYVPNSVARPFITSQMLAGWDLPENMVRMGGFTIRRPNGMDF